MTVLIEARTYGKCLKVGQIRANVRNMDAANILRITKSEWQQYCRGTIPIPNEILIRIIEAGFSFMAFRYRNCPSVCDRRRNKIQK